MMWITRWIGVEQKLDAMWKIQLNMAGKKVITTIVRVLSESYPVQKSRFNPYLPAYLRFFPVIHSSNSNNRFI